MEGWIDPYFFSETKHRFDPIRSYPLAGEVLGVQNTIFSHQIQAASQSLLLGDWKNGPVRVVLFHIACNDVIPICSEGRIFPHCKSINNWWYNRVTLDSTAPTPVLVFSTALYILQILEGGHLSCLLVWRTDCCLRKKKRLFIVIFHWGVCRLSGLPLFPARSQLQSGCSWRGVLEELG